MLTFYSDQEPCKTCEANEEFWDLDECPGHDYEPDGERSHKEAGLD